MTVITMPPERLAEIREHSEQSVPYIASQIESEPLKSRRSVVMGRATDDYLFDADRDRRELLMLLDRPQVSGEDDLVVGMVLADREGGAWGVVAGRGTSKRLICLHTTERPGWVQYPPEPYHVLAILAPVSVVWQP